MKYDKVVRKAAWTAPTVRKLSADDALVRRAIDTDKDFADQVSHRGQRDD